MEYATSRAYFPLFIDFGLIIVLDPETDFLMNMNKLLSGVWILAALNIACKSATSETTEDLSSSGVSTTPVTLTNPSASQAGNTAGTVKHPPTKLGSLMSLNAPKNTFTTAASGVNPAHGMPGHTCALPVGAPLGGTAAPAAQPQAVAQPAAIPALATTPQPAEKLPQPNFKVNPNVAINPAHGEPGHDCSVAVGAPLTKNSPQKDIKINPAHGEPGHDCSVAVGAPLPG